MSQKYSYAIVIKSKIKQERKRVSFVQCHRLVTSASVFCQKHIEPIAVNHRVWITKHLRQFDASFGTVTHPWPRLMKRTLIGFRLLDPTAIERRRHWLPLGRALSDWTNRRKGFEYKTTANDCFGRIFFCVRRLDIEGRSETTDGFQVFSWKRLQVTKTVQVPNEWQALKITRWLWIKRALWPTKWRLNPVKILKFEGLRSVIRDFYIRPNASESSANNGSSRTTWKGIISQTM